MTFYSAAPIGFAGKSMVTLTLGSNDPELGTKIQSGNEEYIFIHNPTATDIKAGYAAKLNLGTGYSCTISTTSGTDFIIGVVKNATISAGGYGFLMTKGFTKAVMQADNSAAAGALLTVAANGEFAYKSNATGYPARAVGVAISAIASGGSGNAYISC